jgi:hypothetical protein
MGSKCDADIPRDAGGKQTGSTRLNAHRLVLHDLTFAQQTCVYTQSNMLLIFSFDNPPT